jgi:hypothetical protein
VLVTYETTRSDDYVREMAAVVGGPMRQWVLSVGGLTALAGAAALAGGTAWGTVGGLLAVGLSVCQFGYAATMLRRALRENPTWMNGTCRYRLDDDGIAWQNDLAAVRYGWASLTSARTARYALHFYAGRRVVMGMPLDGMTPEQLTQVLATLVERDLLRPRPVNGDVDGVPLIDGLGPRGPR